MKSKEKCKQGYIILLKNKVKKKNSFIKICAEIIEYINGGNYLIKIKGNYNYYNLSENEIYCVN